MGECDLCELPTGDSPVTDDDVSGEFCCLGCLEVSRTLADRDGLDPAERTLTEQESDSAERVAGRHEDDRIPDGADEAYLAVDGMHCTTCETFLDLRGEEVEGVHAVDANYAMETARVFYNPETVDESALPDALSGRGYTLRFRDSDPEEVSREQTRRRRKTLQRLIVGGFFSMLIMPWYFFYLYPSYVGVETVFLDAGASSGPEIYIPLAVLGLLTTIVLLYTGFPILRGAAVSFRTRQPNMDLLITVAALAAYAYSTLALATGSTHLYYDVTVVIIMVVTLGRYYEDRSRSRATERLSAVTAARVTEATRLTDDGRETVSIDALDPGDELIVAPGERIPVDGTVTDGVAAVDESLLTGESMPETKRPGDAVIGGSVVTDDALVVEVGPSVESTADRIATTLWEIQSAMPGVQRFADTLATIFVPLVLVLAAVVTGWQFLTGAAVATAMLAGLTVLVVSCPCAMGLATPLAISAGLRDALDHGIVVTNESVFETAPAAETVVFDKTGTLTAGEMVVDRVTGDDDTLRRAGAVERYASHPVADAILDAAGANEPGDTAAGESPTATDGGVASSPDGPQPVEQSDALPRATEFTRHAGAGVEAIVDGSRTVVGTPDLLAGEFGPRPRGLADEIERIENEGDLPVVVGWDGKIRGVVAVTDGERTGWREALSAFEDQRVVILTGDEGAGAEQFREHPAVDEVFAGVPPDGKVETVRQLGRTETTVMVGDGTNDAPALAEADLGVAVGDATAQATSGADVVVTAEELTAVEQVFDLAAGTRRRIRQNVGWALCYNAVAVPLAVAGLINPLFAALAMATSSILVVSNSRRPVVG